MATRRRKGDTIVIDRGLERIKRTIRKGDGVQTTIGIQDSDAGQDRGDEQGRHQLCRR